MRGRINNDYTNDDTIYPVLTSSYRTIDFRNNPNASLYSDGVSSCVLLLIKNFNLDTRKYDNVVTMAHFFPNNAYYVETAKINIQLALDDFQANGGILTKDTSIQLLGGGQTKADLAQGHPDSGAKLNLDLAIKAMGLDRQCKYKCPKNLFNLLGEVIYVLVNGLGHTRILEKKYINGKKVMRFYDEYLDASNLELLFQRAKDSINDKNANKWNRFVGNLSTSTEGMDLTSMETVENEYHVRNNLSALQIGSVETNPQNNKSQSSVSVDTSSHPASPVRRESFTEKERNKSRSSSPMNNSQTPAQGKSVNI